MLTNDQKKALSRVVGFDVFNTPDELLEIFRSTADEELSKTVRCDVCGEHVTTIRGLHKGKYNYCSYKCKHTGQLWKKKG